MFKEIHNRVHGCSLDVSCIGLEGVVMGAGDDLICWEIADIRPMILYEFFNSSPTLILRRNWLLRYYALERLRVMARVKR